MPMLSKQCITLDPGIPTLLLPLSLVNAMDLIQLSGTVDFFLETLMTSLILLSKFYAFISLPPYPMP